MYWNILNKIKNIKMLMEFLVFVVVFVAWWISQDKKKYEKFPPGPPRFPIVGNFPQLMTKSHIPALALEDLAKDYGDIMFLNIGTVDTVVFSSYSSIIEIFNHEKALNRGSFKIPVIKDRMLGRNLGIIWSNDDVWQGTRRFTLRTLRDFGFGKTVSMDFVINEELEKLTSHLDQLISVNSEKNNSTGIVHFDGFFDSTVVNVLWHLVTGVSYKLDDPKMNRLLETSDKQIKSTSFAFDFSIAFPQLREWFPFLFGKKGQLEIIKDLHNFAWETIKEHRQAGTYLSDPKGFIDIYLQKIDEHKNENHPHFNDDNLVLTIIDLFQAGAETTSKSLSFGILYMMLNQEVQEKVHKEITSVVQPNEPITMSLKSTLPYTYATLLETLRHSIVVPFPPMREASDDFYFEGYLIKKGTALLTNVYAAHFSPKVWQDPFVLRPERFLTTEGTVDPKIENLVLPFGGGKRICAGKNLAEASLFLYFTTLMKNYKFEKIHGTSDPSTVPIPGMTSSPQPFNVQISKRQL